MGEERFGYRLDVSVSFKGRRFRAADRFVERYAVDEAPVDEALWENQICLIFIPTSAATLSILGLLIGGAAQTISASASGRGVFRCWPSTMAVWDLVLISNERNKDVCRDHTARKVVAVSAEPFKQITWDKFILQEKISAMVAG